MPRNGSGVYSLPNSAFVSGTVIASAPVNGNFSDIASALTQSISLDGQTTLTGSIKFLNGTAAGPGVAFGGDATTGIYLSSAGTLGIAANGSSVGTWTTSGLAGATIVSPTISSPTISSPTVSGTLAGTAATFSGGVTTNGSLTVNGALTMASPVSVANGGTGDTSLTAYAVLCGGTTTTNPVQSIASVGTAGQTLISNGAGALPTFQTPSMVLLNTLTASNSATLSDTSSLTSTYSIYEIVFINLVPATNAVGAELQVHSGGTFQSTSYLNAGFITTSSASDTFLTGTTFLPLSQTTIIANSVPGVSGSLRVYNPSSTSTPKQWTGLFNYLRSGGGMDGGWVQGFWNGGNGAVDGFQFFFSTGNITSGVIKIYGVA